MNCLKLLILFATFFLLVDSNAKFTTLEHCTSSNVTLRFVQCSLIDGQFNVTFEFVKPVEKIQVFADFFCKIEHEYVEIFKAPKIEWCSIISNKKHKKGVIKEHLEPIQRQFPELFKCPLTGTITLNTSPDYKHMMLFHAGTYRVVFNAHNDDDPHIASMSFILEIEA